MSRAVARVAMLALSVSAGDEERADAQQEPARQTMDITALRRAQFVMNGGVVYRQPGP